MGIDLQGVSKVFGSVVALRQIELSFSSGTTTILAGHNGAGKSTLLSIMSTLMRPTTGTVEVRGQEGRLAGATLRRALGFAPEQALAYAELTGRENLRFQARAFGVARAEQAADRWLDELGLQYVADRPVGGYSQGERRRLGLARALLHDPEVVLLDEPTAGLDVAGVRHLMQVLASRREEGVTLIVSTHDPALAAELGQRVVLLRRGMVCSDTDVADGPALAELMGGGA